MGPGASREAVVCERKSSNSSVCSYGKFFLNELNESSKLFLVFVEDDNTALKH